ncbi:ABC transporter permease subunit [Sneathiella sp. DP05]|uniref:ABC transporter permease subunit n=2 Tax=Sneathiella litorea TaxID=2606216 RepID=A0A6L8WDT4_9PROT|nr:ABC transporter permease subunit [Sneathiella litorea]
MESDGARPSLEEGEFDRRPPVSWVGKQWTLFLSSLPRYSVIALVHIMVVVVWFAVTATGLVHKLILPSPGDTLATLSQPQYQWMENTLVTAWEILAGYCLAVVVGVMLALMFSWFKSLQTTLFPLFVTFSMIPKIALGPLLIVWFGYGIGTNIFFAFILSFFPILITSGRGLREVEPDLLDLVRALKGTRWQIFRKIQLPGAMPYIFSSMKVGAILALAGAIVGEFVASSQGLGYLMIQVQSTLDTAAMFMAVILLSILGIGLFGMVSLLEHIFVPNDARLESDS